MKWYVVCYMKHQTPAQAKKGIAKKGGWHIIKFSKFKEESKASYDRIDYPNKYLIQAESGKQAREIATKRGFPK